MNNADNHQKAKSFYAIDQWGSGYFDINDQGDVVVRPQGGERALVLKELVVQAKEMGLSCPLLLRFGNILQHRVECLKAAFEKARAQLDYAGPYIPVYPIKVNQQREVVEKIFSSPGPVGLEAGSKAELMAVLSVPNQSDTLIIGNGFKDKEYMRLALVGTLMGHQMFIIIEKLSEVTWLIEESRRLGIAPKIGIRVRLSSISKGRWQNSGGERSKFGLNTQEILWAVEQLKQAGLLSGLKCLHVHLGSQIADLSCIRKGLEEAARYFVELLHLGVPIEWVDVGGGLGIDYEGSGSTHYYSMNYSLEAYAHEVVRVFHAHCQKADVPEPGILTESGRALSAHHAVLICQVLDEVQPARPLAPVELKKEPVQLTQLRSLLNALKPHTVLAQYPHAQEVFESLSRAYVAGEIGIHQKAQSEALFFELSAKVLKWLDPDNPEHHGLREILNERHARKLVCNFSLFQSLPDVWAIEQIFPILPLAGLNQHSTEKGVVLDITCDSDGQIDRYVESHGITNSLTYPPQGTQEYIAVFLVGAYQEILGDRHNLFGETDSLHIEIDEQGQLNYLNPKMGESVEEVLRSVDFDPKHMMQNFKRMIKKAPAKARPAHYYLDILTAGLFGYTYLEEE